LIGHHALVSGIVSSAPNSAVRRAVHGPVDRSPRGGQTGTEQAMSRIHTVFAAAIVFAGALSLTGGAAFAASGGSGGSGGSSGTTQTVKCNKGWTYDNATKACVKNQSLNDQQLYDQGRALALAGYYENALDTLGAIRNQNDAMVLTMIGYSERKLGNYDQGLAYYAKALAIDPANINTHEYLGEAYAEKGKLDLANAELVKVEAVCGTTCEQYQDLAKAIAGTPDQS
jgi:tetratricopeptide (TPR) repeat protein